MTGHPTQHADTRNKGAERILIVSDIHSNIEALEACLADARARGGFTRCWNIGDTVGYGPDPVAVLDALRAINVPVRSVKGNHDRTSVRDLLWAQPEYYHRQADYLNWRAMSDADRTVLRAWPEEVIDLGFRIVHDPGNRYVTSAPTANEVLTKTKNATHVAVGHSHDPGYFVSESAPGEPVRCGPFVPFDDGDVLTFAKGCRYLINPGGVGQPRDGDWRTGYLLATIDGDAVTIEARRVPYDVEATLSKLRERDYPAVLVEMLRPRR